MIESICALGIFCGFFITFAWFLYFLLWIRLTPKKNIFTKQQIIEHLEYIEEFPIGTIPTYAKDRIFRLIKQYFKRLSNK